MSQGKTQYPHHLARLVAERLRADYGRSIPETVLVRLLETLYFTSLKTEEGRRVLCMVTYLEPEQLDSSPASRRLPDQWICARFASPLPFDVRNLAKLAQAADPAVSSLAVSSDAKHRLFVCGMIDQEPRYADTIFTDCPGAAARPGLFQAAITGPGNISVYRQGVLVGSLVQNALVEQCHNVLWSGPVREMLAEDLRNAVAVSDHEILFRWLNAISRILVGIRQYRRGGGLVVVADRSPPRDERPLPAEVRSPSPGACGPGLNESRSQSLLGGARVPGRHGAADRQAQGRGPRRDPFHRGPEPASTESWRSTGASACSVSGPSCGARARWRASSPPGMRWARSRCCASSIWPPSARGTAR